MKTSKYNFFYELEDGNYLAFNALKNGLAKCTKEHVERIKAVAPGKDINIETPLLEELLKGGFICDDDFCEYDLLTIRRHIQQYASGNFGLTIAPTLNCNLACTYCFETPDKAIMDDKVMAAVCDFVKRKCESGMKRFSVNWYGGEPLLGMNVIEKLSREFIRICDKNNVEYSAFIITNGVLYNRKVAETLKELNVTGVQITIDGDRDAHDARRPFVGGQGSYERIFQNIKDTVGIIPIHIRTNVDHNNMKTVPAYYEKLKDEEWFGKHYGKMITIHYGYVRKFTKSCGCSKDESLKPGEFYKNELDLWKFLHQSGYKFNKYPDTTSGCCATNTGSYLVGPDGAFYKCWNHIGLIDKKVGSVFDPVSLNSVFVSMLAESFEKDPECVECKYLPICMGGCVDVRISAKKGELDGKDCKGWKFYLDEVLKQFYLSKTGSK